MKHALLALVCVLLLASALGVREYTASGPLSVPKTLVLARGTGVEAMAATLEAEGVVRSRWHFLASAVATRAWKQLKAGEYMFPAGISVRDALGLIQEGRVVVHQLTVPEGLTSREVVALLMQEPALSGEVPTPPPEGSLLPETYQFLREDTRAGMVARMQRAMQETLADAWRGRAPNVPLATPEQALVLASIVEKETGVAVERGQVAAVYVNRLRSGMRLQADPTVAYGLNKNGTALTLDDLRAPTPYNTYVIDGLPPTPIANPGRAALEAALNPPASDALFFVADGAGGHRFSATLAEHHKNVQAWRTSQLAERAQ